MFSNIVVMGRLGKDPEIRKAGQYNVCGGSIAVDSGYGERKKTAWFKYDIFGKKGEAFARFRKGDLVLLVGTFEMDVWTKKDGTEVQSPKIKVTEWSFTGEKHDRPVQHQQHTGYGNPADDPADPPF